MKILQIVNPVIPFPASTVGGTERIVQYLVEELVMAGHEVTLMAHNDSLVPAGAKFLPIGTYTDRRKTMPVVWKHILLNKYDVIHNHGRLLYFLPVIWSKVRKIHTFHMAELDTDSFRQFLRLNAVNLTFTPCGRWISDRFSHLGGEWQYIQNGIPENLYQGDGRPANPLAPLVMITRIGPSKGVLEAIEIAKQSNRTLLVAGVHGDYPHEVEWFTNNFLSKCDGNQIQYIGPVNDEQKKNLLNNAAALLIPTKDSEAFNTTMIEANACGCPVLSYNKFCFSEFITDGLNGFKGDTISDLIHMVEKLHTIDRTACRQHFEERYTAKRMTLDYLHIYHNRRKS